MKEADEHTIQQIGIPSVVLMERAALQIVDTMIREKIDLRKALIVCGSGNNGGDGFAAARLLKERGYDVSVFFAGKEGSLSEECRLQKSIAGRLGIRIFTEFPEEEYTVIIDAVFGAGLNREITGRFRKVICWMNKKSGQKVAADIPSGICSENGKVLGTAFRAHLTIAIECVKLGCVLYPGREYAGRIAAVPIGIDTSVYSGREDVCFIYENGEMPYLLPPRSENSHKGSYGKVLMITGSPGMAGAAFLSARAAYAAGAGLVRIYTAEENRSVLQGLLPEAVISCWNGYDKEEMDRLLGWADVVCIGCGLGQTSVSEKILLHTVQGVKKPCVIDADGLNLLSEHMELLEQTEGKIILTPHMKEMSRLTGKAVEEIAEQRMQILDQFTERYPAVCVLKDSRTVAACLGYPKFVNLAGNSAMAKAGSGDVLAGVITGLLAQGMEPFRGAALGVWLHACGGDAARDEKGAYSVLAGDLIDGIQKCIKNAEECIEK